MCDDIKAIALCVVLSLGLGPARGADTKTATMPSPDACRQLADQMETHLREGVLKMWFPRCVDRERGGFHADFREDWSRGPREDRGIVFQARMTWTAAQVAQRHPELAAEYLGYCRHGLDCLEKTMWDAQHGGFYWIVEADGRPVARKHAYGMAFGIYGAAAGYEATKEPRALDLARRAFAWLETRAHDEANGGYHEFYTREGRVIREADANDPTAKKTDFIGTGVGFKSMNAHVHLLESLTELYRVWPDELLRTRLREMLGIVRDKITVEPGCMNLYFTADWRAVPDHDSFGHDVETAFLLLEAAEALRDHDDRTLRVARSLVDHALEWGWDNRHGGFYDKGAAFKPAHGLEKVWWVQAEGLNTLLLMHELSGKETGRYWSAFLKQWDFIWKHQVDHRHGEWFNTVSHDGQPAPGQAKGSNWKAAYHNGRALMTTVERLRRLAGLR